jgi:polysaccharide export outer membrane protein
MKSISTFLVTAALVLWSSAAQAQEPAPALNLPAPAGSVPAPAGSLDERLKSFPALPTNNAEYRLGPGDLIEIGVFGVEEFRHTIRVNASGVVKLPLLDAVTASGLTPAELEQRLTSLLEDDVIKNPQVSVFVKEYRSQPVYVLGSVRSPGQYQITLQMRIVDAISLAGGLAPNADDEAVIQRPSGDGGEQVINVDLKALLENADLQRNIVVKGGDVIHIKERITQTIYVIGEVNRSGALVKDPRQELRLSQVIAWAGGPTKTARLSKGILVRYMEDGRREQLPVDFGQILRGKKEDFFVRANDVIFVPGSRIKDLGQTLLNGVGGTLAALPYRIP